MLDGISVAFMVVKGRMQIGIAEIGFIATVNGNWRCEIDIVAFTRQETLRGR